MMHWLGSLLLFLPASMGASDPVAPTEAAAAPADATGTDTAAAPAGTAPATAPPIVEEGFITTTLESGMTVSIYSDPDLALVATEIWVAIGSAHEGPNELGFAHLFEHLMFGATETVDKETYSRHHIIHGGSENASTGFDQTIYNSLIAPEGHDRVLELEADRFSNLILSPENLAREKKVVTEELRMRTEKTPMARLLPVALRAVFGDHPYNHSPGGTKADIAAADLELVKRFYEGYYHPRNLHLVIAGPVPGPETLARVEELFGDIDKQQVAPPTIPPLSEHPFPERVELEEDIPPIKMVADIYFGPTPGDADYAAYSMMTAMLTSGSVNPLSRLLVNERKQALEALIIPGNMQGGTLLALGSVKLGLARSDKMFRQLDEAIVDLEDRAWLTQDNLDSTRRRLLIEDLNGRYYAASIASNIGWSHRFLGDAEAGLEGEAALLQGVTLDEVHAAWTTYVGEATPMQVVLKRGKANTTESEVVGGAP